MTGMIMAGVLMRLYLRLPFYVATAVALMISLVLAFTSHRSQETILTAAKNVPEAMAESDWNHAQRYAALASIFLCFVVIGSVVIQFPKLANQLGYSASLISVTMGFLPFSRTIGFALSGKWKNQNDISKALGIAKLLLVLAMSILTFFRSPLFFMTCFTLLGFVAATVFSLSQYLCLKNPLQAGRRIGFHESSMLGGIIVGSVFSGILAQNFGFSLTFAFGIALSTLAFTAQPSSFYKYIRKIGSVLPSDKGAT
jgi:predicted MFS family arabinose efflux permease